MKKGRERGKEKGEKKGKGGEEDGDGEKEGEGMLLLLGCRRRMSLKGGRVYERRGREHNPSYTPALTTVGGVASFVRWPCD
jgi:hypothetical protein